MTRDVPADAQNLLIDVDTMDFLDDGGSMTDENMGLGAVGDDLGKDPVTGALMFSVSKGNEPLSYKQNGKVKFKLSPLSSQNICFVTAPEQYRLYPVKLLRVDTTEEYLSFVSRVFEIYRDLGDDRRFSVPTIGVINLTENKEHLAAVNIAMEALSVELELYIEAIKDKPDRFARFYELEECLTIVNCLKTFHFTVDSSGQDSRGQFMKNILAWINRSDGEPNDEATHQVLTSSPGGKECFQSPPFWKLINQLLLRGLFDQAIACIESSGLLPYVEKQCEVSLNAIRDLISLIKRYPMEAAEEFREWKNLALELAQNFSESDTQISGEMRDHLEDTLFLIGGHQNKILNYSKTWYESLNGLFLYYIPSLELCEEYLQISLKQNALDVTNAWEQACVDIIRGKVYSILPLLEALDSCTAAFSAAICQAKGLLENYFDGGEDEESEDILSQKNGMASYMLNNFALELCSYGDRKLWSIAIGLITLSPTENTTAKRLAIAELLPHYPFQTNDDIEWMLSVSAKWRLPQVTKSIYVMLGNKLLYESNTIEAMANFSKAGKFEWVKRYSWMMFEASVLQGAPLDDIILNAIVSEDSEQIIPKELLDSLMTNAMKQTLSPYAVLYQFYEAQSRENWSDALELLLALINFPYLPKCYMVLLVAKFLFPIFLKDPLKVMNEESILSIMEAMETKWDDQDVKSQNIFQCVQEASMGALPETLESLHKSVRRALNLKLCQEYM